MKKGLFLFFLASVLHCYSQSFDSLILDDADFSKFSDLDFELKYSIQPYRSGTTDPDFKLWIMDDKKFSLKDLEIFLDDKERGIVKSEDKLKWFGTTIIEAKRRDFSDIVVPQSYFEEGILKILEDCPDCYEIELPVVLVEDDITTNEVNLGELPQNCFIMKKEPCYLWEEACIKIICVPEPWYTDNEE